MVIPVSLKYVSTRILKFLDQIWILFYLYYEAISTQKFELPLENNWIFHHTSRHGL
jgi:hypothetical protein